MWHIYVIDVQVTEWIDDDKANGPIKENFYTKFLIDENVNEEELNSSGPKLVKVWYFAITTLSTIGYGDFHPVSISERWIASFILMFGVSMFSFIMGQFIEIMINYKSLW